MQHVMSHLSQKQFLSLLKLSLTPEASNTIAVTLAFTFSVKFLEEVNELAVHFKLSTPSLIMKGVVVSQPFTFFIHKS